MQIDDYFGKIKVKFIDLHNKRGRYQFTQIFVRKFRTEKIRRRREETMAGQEGLEGFGWKAMKRNRVSASNPFKLPYRTKIPVIQPGEFMAGKLTWAEIEAFRNFKSSNGYLKDLFLLSDFRFWNIFKLTHKQEEIFGRFYIGDIVKLEIGRCKLGQIKFNQWVYELESNYNLFSAFDLGNERVPNARNYGRLVTAIGSVNLRGFHILLV
ncbi:MAG: hypothetical protein ACTSUC_05090 [Promethearchaeota archaeon]